MGDSEWSDDGANEVYRLAGGRRRYNAVRRMQAEQRRLIVAEIVARNPMALVRRGLAASLARSLGVHRSTILRDIARSFYAPRMCEFRCNGQLLYTVGREWGGGPVVSVVGPDGNEIQGEARRNIIRGLPRYWRKRR